jgi:hypothetical protein
MIPVPALEMVLFLKWLAKAHPEIGLLAEVPRRRWKQLVLEYQRRPRLSETDLVQWERSVDHLLAPGSKQGPYAEARLVADELWPTTWYQAVRARLQGLSHGNSDRSRREAMSRPRLNRLRAVPLHAVPLYTSEDEAFESYLVDHWDALDRLTGDDLDLHPSLKQLRGREDAYVLHDQDEAIREIRLVDLPGLLFWDPDGRSCYVAFTHWRTEQITRAIRYLVSCIRNDPTIEAVRSAREKLSDVVTEQKPGPTFTQHVYGGTAAQGMHIEQNIGLQADQVVAFYRELRSLAPSLPDATRDGFLTDVDLLEDAEQTPANRISAGRRIKAALTTGGTKIAAAAVVAGVDKIVGVLGG